MHNGIFIAAVPACKHSVISGFENMETEKSESTLLALFQKPTNSQETRITFFLLINKKKKKAIKVILINSISLHIFIPVVHM